MKTISFFLQKDIHFHRIQLIIIMIIVLIQIVHIP